MIRALGRCDVSKPPFDWMLVGQLDSRILVALRGLARDQGRSQSICFPKPEKAELLLKLRIYSAASSFEMQSEIRGYAWGAEESKKSRLLFEPELSLLKF